MTGGSRFRPKLLGIVCNWCCYAGADLAGVSRFQYPPYIRLVRVMCSGRIDMKHVFYAFHTGHDGVFLGGCHLNDCHYNPQGNYDALSMTMFCKKVLEYIGINPKRLRIEWVSAGEGIRFAALMNEFSREIEELGPLGEAEGLMESELKERIEKVMRLIPYFKLTFMEKLALHNPDEEVYKTLYTLEEIERAIKEAPSYWIDPEKCRACTACAKRCPVGAIAGEKNKIHVIDQEKCIKCGTCIDSCPPRFAAVTRLVGKPVPPPIPDEERRIVRRAESES